MHATIRNIGNTNLIEKKEHVVPMKCDNKKTQFCISSNKLCLRDGLKDDHWVGHSFLEPLDDVVSKKIKSLREGNNDEWNNFEREIIGWGALDGSLEGPE